VICSRLQLDSGIFATTRPNFNYFGHSHNYDAIIRNFILLVGLILHLFSSINKLIWPINRNNHQISYILKVFYNDKGVYFNVCTKIIYIICIRMYIVHIMNSKLIFEIWIFYSKMKIDISILKTIILFFKIYIRIWNLLFQLLKKNLNFKFLIWIWYFQFKFKKAYFI